MTTQADSPAGSPGAQVVGNAFVEQYYLILHQSPEQVYRFYQDSSVLSRPDSNGVMTSVTTMEGINEKILAMNYKDYIAEIKTADAQQSYGNGVIVLVTGYLTGKDKVRKKFAQSFFLAPQEKGFFVLNDVFRYVDDEESEPAASDPVNSINENATAAPQAPEPEQPSHVPDHDGQVPDSPYAEDLTKEAEVLDPSENEDGSITGEEIVDPPTQLNQSETANATSELSASQEDAPKKSYASILKAMNAVSSPMPVKVPATNVKFKQSSSNQEATAKPAPGPEPSASASETSPQKPDVLEEGYSVYVRNLPQNATHAQLEGVFSKFGPIKQNGVQVRSNKQGFCFGFVEFESLSSMKSAIEASHIVIGSRKAFVEEKKTTTKVSAGASATTSNGRGRYPSSRGGFRNESFRERGNFNGGRGYGRTEFRSRGEFSGKPRGGAGRGSEGYQRVDQNGAGNGAHQN